MAPHYPRWGGAASPTPSRGREAFDLSRRSVGQRAGLARDAQHLSARPGTGHAQGLPDTEHISELGGLRVSVCLDPDGPYRDVRPRDLVDDTYI